MITLSKTPKVCLNCGNSFLQTSLRQKYCGSRIKRIGCSFSVKRQYNTLYLIENKEKLKVMRKEWGLKNPERLKEIKKKAYRKKFPVPFVRTKMSREEAILSARERNKEYYLRHKSRLNKAKNIRTQRKIQSDIGYRLLVRMRFRLWAAMKGKKSRAKTLYLIGCDVATLRAHLESQFKPGMNWKNYGKKGWTVDHIRPLSKVDLNNKEELLRVCHYTNLQPLWQRENLLKGNRI